MLAALLATRSLPPPPPQTLNYGNQGAAATNTFEFLSITRTAAKITTSLPVQYSLILSLPGRESIFDHLNRMYSILISAPATDNPVLLSNTILEVITVVDVLVLTLNTLPVAPRDAALLITLQQRLAVALYRLLSLGRQTYPLGWPDTRDAFG
jgi:hypothetical protein